MIDRDRFTIGYRELRALVEDMLLPPPGAEPDRLQTALQEHLRMHCRNCGEQIDLLPRREGDAFCYACVAPGPSVPQAEDDGDVPF